MSWNGLLALHRPPWKGGPTWQRISETLVFDARCSSLSGFLENRSWRSCCYELERFIGPPTSALERRTYVAAYFRDAGIRRLQLIAIRIRRKPFLAFVLQ
jgi:hypothetical protein